MKATEAPVGSGEGGFLRLGLPAGTSWGPPALEASALALVYLAAGKLGLAFAAANENVSAVWPPTGLALAALVLRGSGVWPGVFLGAFLVNLTTSGALLASASIAVGNSLEGLVGAALVLRFAGGGRALGTPEGVVLFALLAGAVAPTVAATWGVLTLWGAGLAGPEGLGRVWTTWWLGDGAGALIVAPPLLLWAQRPERVLKPRQAWELAALAASLGVAAAAVFGGTLPLDFLCMPPLLWAAFRFGRAETATACLALSSVSVWATAAGRGPFARPDPGDSLLLLQGFVALTTVVALVVAAAVEARREAEAGLRASRDGLEARVAERTAELKRSNADLEAFAAVAAHELQEPVRKLQMFGDLLKPGGGATPAETEEFVGRMQDAARRMGRLVQDILTLARARAGAGSFETVALSEAVAAAAEDAREALAREGGVLEVGPLPTVRGDPGQLQRLFANLLSNALKFRRPGVPPRIRVSASGAKGGPVEVEVADNGIGFEDVHARRIFEPFQRLHRRTDYDGSGLGLAVCASIAARHGGSVRARGVPGEGAVFTVTLPA